MIFNFLKKHLHYYLVDIFIFCTCLFASFWLRVGDELFSIYWMTFLQFLMLYIPVRLVTSVLTVGILHVVLY